MSVALEARPTLFDRLPMPGPAVRDAAPSLEAAISGAWSGLLGRRTVACPVCAGTMQPVLSAGASPVGGRCDRCGARLA